MTGQVYVPRLLTDDAMAALAFLGPPLVVGDEVRADYIVPSPLDRRVATAVAEAVGACAREQGVTR